MKFSESAEWRLKSHVCQLESKTILGAGGVTDGKAPSKREYLEGNLQDSLKKRCFVSMSHLRLFTSTITITWAQSSFSRTSNLVGLGLAKILNLKLCMCLRICVILVLNITK